MPEIQWPAGYVAPRGSPASRAVQGTVNSQLFRLSEVFEEAYSRCGLELRDANHIVEGARSLRLLLQEWANRGVNLWTVVHEQETLEADQGRLRSPLDTIDVMNVFIRMDPGGADQMDYYLRRISTDEYDRIPQKRQRERPYQYWVDRAPRFPELVFWPVPDVEYTCFYSRLRSLRSSTAGLTGEIDAPDRMMPALVAGLAYLVAQKNKDAFPLLPVLKQEYDRQWLISQMEDREKADLQMVPMEVWP